MSAELKRDHDEVYERKKGPFVEILASVLRNGPVRISADGTGKLYSSEDQRNYDYLVDMRLLSRDLKFNRKSTNSWYVYDLTEHGKKTTQQLVEERQEKREQ